MKGNDILGKRRTSKINDIKGRVIEHKPTEVAAVLDCEEEED